MIIGKVMIRTSIYSLILLLFSFAFISCPCNIPEWMVENGKQIINFPEWTTSCNAFSSWMDWQSEDGKRLHDLVDDSIIADDFSGKFRIGLNGQDITIGFNNSKGDWVNLYNWYGDVTNWDDSVVSIEQQNPDNKYIYDCYCKTQKTENETSENKSRVEITKIDNTKFHYKQDIVDKTVIDCDFYNRYEFCDDIYTEPINVPVKFYEYFPFEFFDQNGSFFYFYPVDGSSSYKKIATTPNDFFRYIYCPEGISFKEINEAKDRISFNLLDAEESDYIDYFEIHVISKKNVKIYFYKMNDNQTVLVNTLEKPNLKFEWLLDSETGETQIY